jgi:osmotically-inducible protein OsmY
MGSSLLWRTDWQLRDAVQRALDGNHNIEATGIAVVAADGLITLTGFVNSYTDKLTIEQIVKRVPGVRAIANDLEVKLASEHVDPEIARQALVALSRAGTDDVTVTVRHGFVSLDGVVASDGLRAEIESTVRSLPGDRAVSNDVRVEPRRPAFVSPGQAGA